MHDTATATASGRGGPGGGARGDQDLVTDSDLQALLDNHGKALRSGDERKFLTAYDPAATDLVATQRMLFGNLRKIPLTLASFSLSHQSADVDPGPAVSLDVDVSFVHQITGVDVDKVFEGYRWRVTRKAPGAALLVTSVGGTPTHSHYAKYLYYPAPWDQVPLTVIREPHVLLLANPVTASLARQWAGTAELSARQDLAAWGGRPNGAPGFLVTFEDVRTRFYSYWDGNGTGTSWEAAYTMSLPGYSETDGELDRAMGSRIVSYTGSSFYKPGHDPGYMFTHEMAHALVATVGPRSGSRTPLYIVEGFARFMETRHRSAQPFLQDPALAAYVKNGFTGHLPTDGQLRSADDDVAGASYELSLLVYLFIEHKFGSARCFDLVVSAYETPTESGGSAALTKATGMSVAAFEAEWSSYVHQRIG
ncbi:MAG: hypothetical protein DLM59_12790 [Pseudonocardiales bacterium]|nr:MAG: hypothetical protein DLM59_12790 [Pseudonocardiales bacterium]